MTTGDEVGDTPAFLSVNYEIQRLQSYHDRLLALADAEGEKDVEAMNAFLEGFLIHFRNLLNFLDSRGGDDDIKATDFVPEFKSTIAPEHYRSRINKRLAHLSRSRPEYPRGWEFPNMLSEIRDAWNEFMEQALALASEEE